jgi:hypothetical protein
LGRNETEESWTHSIRHVCSCSSIQTHSNQKAHKLRRTPESSKITKSMTLLNPTIGQLRLNPTCALLCADGHHWRVATPLLRHQVQL